MESQSHRGKARILYAQSRVAVHPTPYAAHNQSGFLTLLERVQGDGDSSTPSSSSSLAQRNQKDISLSWLPETTAKQRGDVARLIEVELREAEGLRSSGRECEEAASRESNDDAIYLDELPSAPPAPSTSTTTPPQCPPFCHPLGSIYSIRITPPTVSNWNSSLVINLIGGEALPTLYFHDDESRKTALGIHRASNGSLASSSPSSSGIDAHIASSSPSSSSSPPPVSTGPPPSSWGGDELVQHLRKYVVVHRSVHDQRTFLINPKAADLEAHSTPVWADNAIDEPPAHSSSSFDAAFPDDPFAPTYPRRAGTPQQSLQGGDSFSSWAKATRMSLLSQFSHVTRSARDVSRHIIEQQQHAAQRYAGRAPAAVATYAQAGPLGPFGAAPSSSSSSSLSSTAAAAAHADEATEKAGVAEYDSARVYLAKWARLVAEEGERSRKRSEAEESTQAADKSNGDGTAIGTPGSWEMLDHPDAARHRLVRQYDPITAAEWEQWSCGGAQGRPTIPWRRAKRQVYARGLAPSARPAAWPVLLGVVPWDVSDGERQQAWERRREGWQKLRDIWAAGLEEGHGFNSSSDDAPPPPPPLTRSDTQATETSFESDGTSRSADGEAQDQRLIEMARKLSRRRDIQEQQHRIRVDVLRTDRKLPLFRDITVTSGGEDVHAPTEGQTTSSTSDLHMAKLAEVLMTYTIYDTLFVGGSRGDNQEGARPSRPGTATSVTSKGSDSTAQQHNGDDHDLTVTTAPNFDLPTEIPPLQLARLASSKSIATSSLGGYVQGMSDLCAAIYSVVTPDTATLSSSCAAFWTFTSLMTRTRSSFLASQAGIKAQLLSLQVLLRHVDAGLYKHLERTGSLDLFTCFRWLLVRFRREFDLEGLARLWECGWALEPCADDGHDDEEVSVPATRHHHLFVCLAILVEHRDAVVGHLRAFDEVLAFYQSLSGTMDVEVVLGRAERLMRGVEEMVRKRKEGEAVGDDDDLEELRRLFG